MRILGQGLLASLLGLFAFADRGRQSEPAPKPEITVRVIAHKPAKAEGTMGSNSRLPSALEIKKLIAGLAEIDKPDIGLSPTLSGRAFAPVANSKKVSVMVLPQKETKTSDCFRTLVQLGPSAIPLLLEALDRKTPTRLIIKPSGLANLGFPKDGPYTIKIGDICYVALGQIVGRPYNAVSYIPSGIICVTSPTKDPELVKRLRSQWSSDNPGQHLYQALLADYQTKPIFNGESLDGWDEGSQLQIEAAMRLLYYFPDRSGPTIANRLHGLKVGEPDSRIAGINREVDNGVRTVELIRAVVWCKEPIIRGALAGIFQRTSDPQILLATLPAIEEPGAQLIVRRLESMLEKLPKSEDGWNGNGYDLLVAVGHRLGKMAKPVFEQYLRNASLQRRWTMCYVLQKTGGEWAIELLGPMLTDKGTGYGGTSAFELRQFEPRKPVRLCDVAAQTISKNYPDLKFTMVGKYEDLDEQISQMREQIARRKIGKVREK